MQMSGRGYYERNTFTVKRRPLRGAVVFPSSALPSDLRLRCETTEFRLFARAWLTSGRHGRSCWTAILVVRLANDLTAIHHSAKTAWMTGQGRTLTIVDEKEK